jgi:hypothetical protein
VIRTLEPAKSGLIIRAGGKGEPLEDAACSTEFASEDIKIS